MKKSVSPVLIVVLLIILVALAGIASLVLKRYLPGKEVLDSRQYFNIADDSEIAIVLNQELLEEKGTMIEGSIYLPEQMVSKHINTRFYWDEQNQEMLYTLPEEVITLKPDSMEYVVNAEARMEQAPMIRTLGDQFYVSLEFLKQYTNMTCDIYEDPGRVVIRTLEGAVQVVNAKSDYQIREKGGIKSLILTEGEKGDALYFVEAMETWSKVSTSSGYTGYVKNEDISEIREEAVQFEAVVPEYTSIQREKKINLSWHLVTSEADNQKLEEKIAGCTGMNVISPTWFTLADTSGGLKSLASAEYIQKAHAAGLEVWGLIENINTDVSTLEVLSVRENRSRIIEQLITCAASIGMDGINVDFESITEDSAPHYVQFVREISVACRKAGLVLSVDVPVPMPYNQFYDRKELGIMTDYVIIMGYDEHYAGSEEAGSVASLPFVESGIIQTLEVVPKEKVVNGIPFYTRLWIEPFGSSNLDSQALGMDQASAFVEEHGMEVYWDASAGQNVAEMQDNEALYQIWLEDEESVAEKMKLIQAYDLAGVASWQLGYQRNTVWEIMNQYLQ